MKLEKRFEITSVGVGIKGNSVARVRVVLMDGETGKVFRDAKPLTVPINTLSLAELAAEGVPVVNNR